MTPAECFETATETEARDVLWTARKNAYWAARGLRPGTKGISTDVCVPISALAACVEESKADARECGLVAPIVGHVGDGNFHSGPQFDPADPEDVAKAKTFVERLVRRALDMGGTCTGEHGVGQAKIKYMREEHSPETLNVMRAIKRALDPQNIMNPGKVLDA